MKDVPNMIDDEREDFETPAAPGKFMGLFFGAAILCAVFFGLGYKMGKGSSEPVAGASIAEEAKAAPIVAAPKPSPARVASEESSSDSGASNLTFYKSVQTRQADAKLAPKPEAKPKAAQPAAPAVAKSAPEMAHSVGGSFIVQVAAVGKEDDAEALLSALRKKNYPVFLVNNQPGDKLFHVQVGPFASMADAEQMRSRLSGDGYNPILKK